MPNGACDAAAAGSIKWTGWYGDSATVNVPSSAPDVTLFNADQAAQAVYNHLTGVTILQDAYLTTGVWVLVPTGMGSRERCCCRLIAIQRAVAVPILHLRLVAGSLPHACTHSHSNKKRKAPDLSSLHTTCRCPKTLSSNCRPCLCGVHCCSDQCAEECHVSHPLHLHHTKLFFIRSAVGVFWLTAGHPAHEPDGRVCLRQHPCKFCESTCGG